MVPHVRNTPQVSAAANAQNRPFGGSRHTGAYCTRPTHCHGTCRTDNTASPTATGLSFKRDLPCVGGAVCPRGRQQRVAASSPLPRPLTADSVLQGQGTPGQPVAGRLRQPARQGQGRLPKASQLRACNLWLVCSCVALASCVCIMGMHGAWGQCYRPLPIVLLFCFCVAAYGLCSTPCWAGLLLLLLLLCLCDAGISISPRGSYAYRNKNRKLQSQSRVIHAAGCCGLCRSSNRRLAFRMYCDYTYDALATSCPVFCS